MSNIDLSKYVGKRVIITLKRGSSYDGTLVRNLDAEDCIKYPFSFNNFTYTADGKWHTIGQSEDDIIKIEELQDTSTPIQTKEQSMLTKEDYIKALEAMGYAVTLNQRITIDWSKQPAWVAGYVIDAGSHYVISVKNDKIHWINDYSGWDFDCDCACAIPIELSPLKDYKGHSKNSLHLRPSASDKP